MSAAAEVQIGKAEIYGIQNDGTAIAIVDTTDAGVSLIGNLQDVQFSQEAKETALVSQDGAVIESIITCQRTKSINLKIVPNGANRAAAQTIIDALAAMAPQAIITTTHFKSAHLNGTWNYKTGGKLQYTPEGWCVADIVATAYQIAADGSFAALTIAT